MENNQQTQNSSEKSYTDSKRQEQTQSQSIVDAQSRATLEKIGERADARPEALSLDQWVRFAQELNLMKKDE